MIPPPMSERNPTPADVREFDSALDTSPQDLERLLERVGRRLAAFVAEIGAQPAQAADQHDSSAAWVREALPERPAPLDDVLDLLFGQVVPAAFNTASPGYLAYIPGGGLVSAAAAELIAAVVNRYTGLWISAPGPVDLEANAVRWLVELMGMPASALGVLTSGASLSTLIAMVAAREKIVGDGVSRATVYVSRETHHIVQKAARVAGVPAANVRTVGVDASYRLRVDELEDAVADDRLRGLLPFFVCGSAGTVNTGAIDPLDDIADFASRDGLWFHVDGAYGAAFRLVPELAGVLRGMERCDSLAMDPHKGLFLAYGTGALLVRDPADLRRAYAATGSYLPAMRDSGAGIDYCEHTPELSRDWRGLRLWLPLKLHGAGAFRDALRDKRRLALEVYAAIAAEPDVEIAAPPELSLFAFRQRVAGDGHDGHGGDTAAQNRHNRELLARVNAPRRIMLTGTEIDGVFWLRCCVLHLRTRDERIAEAIALLRAELAAGRR